MGKIWVEICLISGRGLRRTSSLWRLQWFAVGWIDPKNKYCTKIDASGNNNPVWKTKFSIAVNTSEPNFQDLALHVEVYSREPIFLRKSLLGTATIVLKEFMDKYISDSEGPKPVEEVGSFQLRKKNSNKPQGFIDISIQISEERKDPGSSSLGGQEEYNLRDHSGGIRLPSLYGPQGNYQPQLPQTQPQQLANHPLTNSQYAHPMPIPTNYSQPPSYPPVGGPSYQPVGGPSYPLPPPLPPAPPSNVGYTPTFLPGTNNVPSSFINMPSSARPTGTGRGGLGLGMGVGAGVGALAAGAMIYGDDFMSGFDFPGGLQDASLTISANPPF
ncbi:SRC2 homolog [Olea europaea subsp. europaea]|uniref:SRC2 homolog n=1 Tax=Olea europaea subsp. europaea TaxID=158383 RepID=A0A8S0PI35_OLEEU|nr:SRC2 homolog [Olea europaea subsp. europaea]